MKNKILAASIRIKQIISRILFYFFPINKSKIIIVNYVGASYGDNAKYIVENLLSSTNNLTIIWALSNNKLAKTLPKKVKPVKYNSIKFFYELYTSRIWIDNCRKHRDIKKKRGQFYIQVWHGDLAFKKIEADTVETLPKKYIKSAKNDGKMTDLMISGSSFFTKLCHNSFWYNGEVLECGCPRNDILFDTRKCKKIYDNIRKYYKLNPTDKILFYAPTFRKDQSLKYYNIDYENTLKSLEKKFGGNWIILVRLHPNISGKSKYMNIWKKNIINATGYPDAQELLIASDIMITDYSSIAFDFALLRRPVFLFAPDYELYNKDRGFYLDYFNLPFSVAEKTSELQKNISDFSRKDYKERLAIFLKNKVGSKETGKASEKIAKIIIEKTK